jgi:hypothetical protein
MFEVDLNQAPYEVDDLDASACLERVGECDVQDRMASRRKLRLTLRWCQIKQVADPDKAADWGESQSGSLRECDLSVGGEGTPMVAAYSAAPFGAKLGVSTQSAMALMSDALDLKWRLRRLHAQVEDLTLPLWKARRVAQATTMLSVDAAAFVDEQLAERARGFGVITIDRIVALAIARFHPELLEEATKAGKAAWDVTLEHPPPGQFTGTSHLSATGDTLALTRFMELVSIVAIALGRLGDTDPLAVRKAKAFGVIADPDELADLLTRADQAPGPDNAGTDDQDDTTPAGASATTDLVPTDPDDPDEAADAGAGEHGATRSGEPTPTDTESEDLPAPAAAAGRQSSSRARSSSTKPRPNTGVVGGLIRKPAKIKLYAHLSPTDLTTIAAATGETVVIGEVERLGPATLGKIREWLGTTGATITPVIDLNRTAAVDVHDPPEWMRELVILRDQHCVFPWCATDARSCDLDHIEPYHHGPRDGPQANRAPPGQTHPDNLACLCRRHHRTKTFKGWSYRRMPDGSYRWKDPYGNTYLVTKNGTHNLNSY